MQIEITKKKIPLDTNDFDISFVRGLNLEDGVTTLTDFTASIIAEELIVSLDQIKEQGKALYFSVAEEENNSFNKEN